MDSSNTSSADLTSLKQSIDQTVQWSSDFAAPTYPILRSEPVGRETAARMGFQMKLREIVNTAPILATAPTDHVVSSYVGDVLSEASERSTANLDRLAEIFGMSSGTRLCTY